MDSLVLEAVVLYIAVCFGLSQSQGSHDFQPIIHNVSMTKYFHRLHLEWVVHNGSKTYNPETKIIFNIQVNQTEENHIVLNTNYTVSLNELIQPLNWSWDPLVPLQCEHQVIRIRSLVEDKSLPHSGTWSDWSPWEAVRGLDTVDDNKDYVFPKDHILKAGSNFTFCCIARKTELVEGFHYHNTTIGAERKQRKVLFHLNDVPQGKQTMFCSLTNGRNPGKHFYVFEVPNKPKNLACKTEDMITLECSWEVPETKHETYTEEEQNFCRTELILSDVANTTTYYEKILDRAGEYYCSFQIANKTIPKLRLSAKNCFGEAHTDYDFYETHKAPSGHLDIWRDIRPGLEKNVTIFWKPSPDFHANGVIQEYEIQWEMLEEPTVSDHKSVKPEFNSTTIFLDGNRNSSYKISVSAKNLINSSLPSVLLISTAEDHIQEVNGPKDIKPQSTNGGISISWKPRNQYDGYIVDWCNYPNSQPCDFQWKRFGGNYSSDVIKSNAFRFNVTYTFRVYGSLNNVTYLLEKKALYLEEPGTGKDRTETHNPSVKTYDDLFASLLMLVIVPIMLLICICFWKSSCIRNHYFLAIPRPDVSPFLKHNPGTMEICDVALDKVEVIENHQTATGKQSHLGMLIVENIAYFEPASHLPVQEQEAGSKNLSPPTTSYKPLRQDFFAVKPPSTSYKPLQDFFANSPPSTSYKPLEDFFAVSPPSTSYKPLQDFFADKPISQPPPQDQGSTPFQLSNSDEMPNSSIQQSDQSNSV